jgi:hypothetical protein
VLPLARDFILFYAPIAGDLAVWPWAGEIVTASGIALLFRKKYLSNAGLSLALYLMT